MNKHLIVLGIAVLLLVGLSGCFGYGQGIKAEKIEEGRTDFYNITQQQFDQFPLKIKKVFNNSNRQINITYEDFQTFMNISTIDTDLQSSFTDESEFYSWNGYISHQGMIYYLETDNYENYHSFDFSIVKLVDVSVNITEQQMDQFPHLKEAIKYENTHIGMPRDEFDALSNLLDITVVDFTRISGFVEYENEYYQIYLAFSG